MERDPLAVASHAPRTGGRSKGRWVALSVAVILTLTVMPTAERASGAEGPGGAIPPPEDGTAWLGVSVAIWPDHEAQLDEFVAAAGKSPAIIMDYRDWAHYPEFDRDLAERVRARGATLMLTWEPWDYTGGPEQPTYSLRRIADGAHDGHIRRWARGIRSWGYPMFLRFGHEMNGDWNSWSEGVNGNRAGEYVEAWRRVHTIFQKERVSNVAWVWSPNVSYSGSTPIGGLYPGDGTVDWVALDGYNWGDHHDEWKSWQSFAEVFEASVAELIALAPDKPFLIAETASAEEVTEDPADAGTRKTDWIDGMFDLLGSRPEFRGLIWFNHDKEQDWRIQSTSRAAETFATRVADPRYVGAASATETPKRGKPLR